MRPAVLFDVDGTLVKGQGAGRQALARGLAQVLRIPMETALEVTGRIDYRGSTDQRIFEQIFGLLDLPLDSHRAPVIEAYLAHLPPSIEASEMALLPGVRELIEQLEASAVQVGLLTGNLREAARLKVAPFGLAPLADRPGGFGDDARAREEIARIAWERLSRDGAPRMLVVIGDTEWDVRAARAVGAKAVAVETGWTPRDRLAASAPDLLLADLRETGPLTELLDLSE